MLDPVFIIMVHQRTKNKVIVIVGAGPAGLLLAHYLLRRPGYDIVIIEGRPDPRILVNEEEEEKKEVAAARRTFPISICPRGKSALSGIPGLLGTMENRGVFLVGICLHNGNDATKKRVINKDPPMFAMDRNDIVMTLLTELDKVEKAPDTTITFHFEAFLQEVDTVIQQIVVTPTATSISGSTTSCISFDYLIAADGSRSKIRQHLVQTGRLHCDQKVCPDDYRTIFLTRTSQDHSIKLDSDKMHFWMFDDGKIKIMQLPIHKGCVSGVIIFNKGKDPFQGMKTPAEVQDYFETLSPNFVSKLMTEQEAHALLNRPTSSNTSVRCSSLHVGQILLVGDAAHAVSASAGQGCNSALQDVQVFCGLLDRHQDDWDQALPAYTAERHEDILAISELSDYNTPRTNWMKKEYIIRMILKKILPSFLARMLLRPFPAELLSNTNLSYTAVLEKTCWWINRVKRTHQS